MAEYIVLANEGQKNAFVVQCRNAIRLGGLYNTYQEFIDDGHQDFVPVKLKSIEWVVPVSVYDDPLFVDLKGIVDSNAVTIREVLQSEFQEYTD